MKILLELAPHELTDSWVSLIRATRTVELPSMEEQKVIVEQKAVLEEKAVVEDKSRIVNKPPKKTWTTSPESVKAVDAGTGAICGSPTPEDTPPLNIPSGNPAITLDDIKVAAANLLATGGVQKKDLQELNSMFNIKSLMELKPEQFPDYVQTLRGMGAVI